MSDESVTEHARPLLRFGWLAKGALFVIIGLLSLELARRGLLRKDADQRGALEALAGAPVGRITVFAVSIGLLLYAAWQVWSAVVQKEADENDGEGDNGEGDNGDDDNLDEAIHQLTRVGWVGLAAIYALLASTGLTIAIEGTRAADDESGGGPTSPSGITKRLFDLPGGRGIVVIVGVVTIIVALYQLWKGVRRNFLDDIDTSGVGPAHRRILATVGTAGFAARALLMGTAGWLFIDAAWLRDPDRAAGLDDSLRILTEAPGGQALLVATGAGLIAAGAYDMATFRRQRIDDV